MDTDILRADHPVALRHAVDILRHGGLVAFPTDTVYGLAAQPFDSVSVERLFIAKGRNTDRAIAILIGDMAQLDQVTKGLSKDARLLASCFWPGPLTLVVPRHPSLPAVLSPLPTIGVRFPDHQVAVNLLRMTGPLAVTSANLSSMENANTAQEVMAQLKGRIHLILDGGPTPGKVPSTVLDCTEPELTILREGPIKMKDIRAALDDKG